MRALSPLVGPWPWVRWLVGLALLAGLLQPGAAEPKSATAKSAADYFVHSLPGAPAGVPLVKMHAG
jgi:carboxypeptidase D